MTGIEILNALPKEIKGAIANEFGNIEELYKHVFDLKNEDYNLFKTKPAGFEIRRNQIQNEIFDIEDKLDAIGLDGHEITTEISNDHGDIIVNNQIQQLDNYLQQFGTDFQTMRDWMKRKFNI